MNAPLEVTVRDVPATRVALLVHRGPPEGLDETVQRFIAFRRANGLPPATSATFNILYDDMNTCAPDAFRFGLAASLEGALAPNDVGVIESELPAGRCATVRHVGDEPSLFALVRALYVEWLPASGEVAGEFPLYLQRVRGGLEPDAETLVFLPLRDC
jgi:AraC family transcriptional regulator